MSKIKKIMKRPVYFLTSPASRGLLNWVPDRIYLKMLYRLWTGEKLNLKNPVTFNEKVQWLKLYDRKEEYKKMVDKYEVREYIAGLIGESYLVKCYGVYDSFEQIDFAVLPEKFVMKCTHDSGSVVFCKNKKTFDKNAAKKRLERAMKRSYYGAYREWSYKDLKPRIIIEEYLEDGTGRDLTDYKIMCFNGKAKLIMTHENRYVYHTQAYYDIDWNKTDLIQPYLPLSEGILERPAQLEKIYELSELIAKDMYHARIDWYVVKDKIYFGEITFYSASGLEPFVGDGDKIVGAMLDISR